MTARNDTRWVTAAMLQALAQHGSKSGDRITAPLLRLATAGKLTPRQHTHATTRMCALGFLTHRVAVIEGQRVDVYTLTPEGAAAVQAAGLGEVRKSGPKGPHGHMRPTGPQTLSGRLWALMRVRRALDSDSAARVLCDAGEQDFKRVQATVRRTLARWAATGAVARAARRVKAGDASPHSNGCQRFVLMQDSPTPPRWRQPNSCPGGRNGQPLETGA